MRHRIDFKLYVITGESYHPGRGLLEVMEAALKGGADMIQLRDKEASKQELLGKARALRELTSRYGVPLIINDYTDIAMAVHADGVHLGQEDMPLQEARKLLGPDRIIGISTHSIEQAIAAQRDGADYIGVGPVYPTGTKPGRQAVTTAYVSQAAAEIRIPFVAIGGITPHNADEVLKAGATRLCAVSAIVGHPDPETVCRILRNQIAAWSSHSGDMQDTWDAQDAASAESAILSITVNGQQERTKAATMLELAEQFKLIPRTIVAELDGVVVPRRSWGETPLQGGCSVEFVHFVGGG